jgi:hypothetical protein
MGTESAERVSGARSSDMMGESGRVNSRMPVRTFSLPCPSQRGLKTVAIKPFLLADDDPNDVVLILIVQRRIMSLPKLIVLQDGGEALN